MKSILIGFALLLCSVLALCFFTSRTQFELQLFFWVLGFVGYLMICLTKTEPSIVPKLLVLAVLIRILACFSFPVLSDDIYRFIWDGELNLKGVNVYEFKPTQIQENTFRNQPALFNNLNSKQYFTVYPPIDQMLFTISAYLGKDIYWKSVILKAFLLVGEICLMFLISQILKFLNRPQQKLFLYVFNPLVIVEICGNAHFEGLALLALLSTLYLIYRNKTWLSGFTFVSAVLIKLNPLIYLPVLAFQFKNGVKSLKFLSPTFIIALFFVHNSEALNNIFESLSFYFIRFEFNAGIYYLLRYLGYYLYGHNTIAFLGPAFLILTGLIISYLSLNLYKKKKVFLHEILFYICLAYILLSPVLHPWYLIPLIGLSLFTNWRFPLVWSFLIFISYHVYGQKPYMENMFLVYLEYVFLLIYVLIEIAVPKWQKV
ncbi:MAG TPA: hypothetical protein EYQ86_05745 [Bacteroidetes bacterium]|nr:hypothetical protein [Bacteroidota bacterium]